MLKKVPIISSFFLLMFLSFSLSDGFCADHALAHDTPAPEGTDSFYHRTLSGKYNLLEEDFSDVPHRTSKYDYLKEDAEKLRFFSRPDGPEFAILNLQWKNGNVFVNTFDTASGRMKKRRMPVEAAGGTFFYRLFSAEKSILYEGALEVPFIFHFDYIDEDTGELTGGALKRSDLDFTLKIPLPDKAAEKIIFYRRGGIASVKSRVQVSEPAPASEEGGDEFILGETQF